MQLTKWEKQRLITMLDTEITNANLHCGAFHESTMQLKELREKISKEEVTDGKRD